MSTSFDSKISALLKREPHVDRGRTRHVTLAPSAIEALPGYLDATLPADKHAVVICDDHTHAAAGKRVIEAIRASGRTCRVLTLEPRVEDDHLVCEDGAIAALRTILAAGDGMAVAVGAGTVNDIVKMATHELERDYVVVPTAASMNGYTSLIAAVLVGGVKRTLPAQQPVAIFADTDVLVAAPAHLNRAGFGDLVSKPFSNADWLLSSLVRGVPFNTAPSELLDEVFAEMLDAAAAIGRAERAGLATLMQAILLSGYSMTIAGSSSPASGGEHLVSHYWDMEQLHHNAPLVALHGTQVGVATRQSAMLFERLLATDVGGIDVDALVARRADASYLDTLAAAHPNLDATIVGEIRTQLASKQKHGAELRAELVHVRDSWDEMRPKLAAMCMPVETLTRALQDAGCAERASQLGVDQERAIRTLRVCRHIRGRYVALDLIADLGLLDSWAAEVVARAEA